MKKILCFVALIASIQMLPAQVIGDDQDKQKSLSELMVVKSYQVADLIISPVIVQGNTKSDTVASIRTDEFQSAIKSLNRFLEERTDHVTGKNGSTIEFDHKTLSLVIRQTPAVHDQIADQLRDLRREQDFQVGISIEIITGPRIHLAHLAKANEGELGRYEKEQLLKEVKRSEMLTVAGSYKITLFNNQSYEFRTDERMIVANAKITEDNRAVRLKIFEGPAQSNDPLSQTEIVDIHAERSVVLRFEAPVEGFNIPPANDAVERLLIITPQIIVQEEEEELLSAQ